MLTITSINIGDRQNTIRNYIERCSARESVYDYILFLEPKGEATPALSNLSTALPFRN